MIAPSSFLLEGQGRPVKVTDFSGATPALG